MATEKNQLATQLFLTAQSVKSVLAGQSLSAALNSLSPEQKPGVQAISFYIMRRLGFAQEMRNILVPKKPGNKLLEAMLLVGLSLLEASLRHAEGLEQPDGTPIYQEYTLVDQMVTATSMDRHTRFNKALLNAVLRRYSRERDDLLTKIDGKLTAIWNHPAWWIKELRKAWPRHWQEILHQANEQPPMHLRVNLRKINAYDLSLQLKADGIDCTVHSDSSLTLNQAYPINKIPGHSEGLWSVQDISAQKAAFLLPLKDKLRVLDACAAPGGKTAHLLELYNLDLTALDSDDSRLKRVHENLQRLDLLGPDIKLKCADASNLLEWWDGKPFDAILADVPCTGSGVVRRHPDIRWLRRASDIKKTVSLQGRIINSLWQTLTTGGYMLYVTCSIFPQEGEQQINKFMAQHDDAIRLSAPGQLLPSHMGDGFFYALLQKRT